MDNQLDPQALALAKAIRRTETGGHKDPYNARGASGEFGAFQFMPATYKSLAQKHLGNANAAPTVENQNKIVYSEIKKLKDQGYNPAQIASIWNSGNPDRYKNGGVGVNKYGVSYNVPQYVSKVSQNYKALIGTVQPVQQQAPEQPVEPTIEEQKQERIAQGLPVSVREDRAEPTVAGNIVRGIVKPFVSAATTVLPAVRSVTEGYQPFEETYRPVKTKYLGDVYSPGAKGIVGLEQAKTVGDVVKSTAQATTDIAGKAIEIGSYGMGGSTIAGLKGVPAIKQGIVEGAKLGAVGGFGSGLQAGAEQDTLGGALGQVALQTGAGAAIGGVLGGATTGIAKGGQNFVNRNKPEVISSKIDNEIANIFKGTTGDVDKIRESSFKARKGIELLQKESPNIKIPDEKAPLGTRETKAFNPATAKPNELLSGVKEMDNLIVSKMKKATEDARSRGFEVNTNDAKLIIRDAIDSGDIPKAAGERMLKQIDSIGNDPVKAHDWVQDVNVKYKKKYERGTIDDTAVGSLADDVAQVLRDNLDLIVDRKGYAEAYGNNQELKRMLVAIAKKANKQVNWGDITTDAGLDAAISLLTGNPAYMARTVATSLFKSVWSKFRNNAGLRSFRSAVKGTAKVGTETRLPFSVAKPQFKSKNLLPEGKGFENKAGIQLGKPKTPTTFEPRAKVVNTQPRAKQLALPAPKNVIELPKNVTKATLGSDATENALMRNTADRRKLINKPKTRIISEESYKKALKNLGDTSTLNSTPIHLSKDALIVAGYHIENGVRSAAELGIELAKKGYKFTKEQLEELFNKANKNVEIEPLIQEAKKYKSAEEFVKAYKKIPDYAMSHRPTQSGSGYNIDEFGNAPDFYKNPRFFKYSSDGTYDESISALLKIKDKPEATITIYRASPQNDLNFGDWVSLSKKYAKQASLSEGTKVHSFKVKAKDIQFAGDDINEFGYYPTDETIKEKWFSLQPKTNNPKDYKNANDFIDAMYEKGIFKNIESSQKRWEKEMELEEIWNKANKSPLPKAKEVSENVNVIRTGGKLGSEYNTDLVARERFNIPELKKVSFGGSDRDVYDLGDNKVVKITKSSRGLTQQSSSADYYAEDAGLIPKTIEVGKNYIVKEKVLPPNANTKKMISEIKDRVGFVTYRDYDKQQEVIEILNKYGYNGDDLQNYQPLWGDLLAIRNWGSTNDGSPILLDEGTLFGDLIKNDMFRGKNLNDPEFREIYEESKKIKKKFGDVDKKTMYGLTGIGLLGSTTINKKENKKTGLPTRK